MIYFLERNHYEIFSFACRTPDGGRLECLRRQQAQDHNDHYDHQGSAQERPSNIDHYHQGNDYQGWHKADDSAACNRNDWNRSSYWYACNSGYAQRSGHNQHDNQHDRAKRNNASQRSGNCAWKHDFFDHYHQTVVLQPVLLAV